MKQIGIAALMFGLSVGGSVAIASTWKGTIGEPLRDSTAEAIQLADHLRSIGAKFYGAWTCPACFRQMNLFGKQAGADVPYIECRKPKQLPEQASACTTAKIRAYPTWVMPDGSRREGIQSLAELTKWSGLR